MRLLILLLLAALGGLWFWGLRRAGTLFVVKLQGGRAELVRGRMPPRLLSDIEDIASRAASAQARIECRASGGTPHLAFSGNLTPSTQQQLRNVLAGFTIAQLRTARRR